MKTWREAAGFPERHQLLLEALKRTDGNQREAAKLLGLSREHVSRLLSGRVHHTRHGSHGNHAVTQGHGGGRVTTDTRDSAVTPSSNHSLTSGDLSADIEPVSRAAVETPVAEDVGIITVEMPKSCIEWLDFESVRWKHQTGANRPSKSAVVTMLVRKAMEQKTKKPGRARTEGEDGGGGEGE